MALGVLVLANDTRGHIPQWPVPRCKQFKAGWLWDVTLWKERGELKIVVAMSPK